MTAPTPTATTGARRATRNALALMLASVLSKGALFLWQIVLFNWLGPTETGVYSTVVSLMAITAPIVNFGLGVILIRDVARRPAEIGRYWTAILFLQTGLALLAYLSVVGLALAGGYSPVIVACAAVGGLSLLIDIFGSMGSDLLLAQERMTITASVEVVHIALRVALAALALGAGWGLAGVYLATLFTGVVRSLLLWGANLRLKQRPALPLDRALAGTMLWHAAPLALNALLVQAYQHADKLMMTGIIGERSTGYMSPAFTIHFGVVEVLNSTVLIALFPLMSRTFGDGRQSAFGRLTATLLRFVLIVSLPVTLLLSIYADVLIGLLFRADYAPSGGILRLLIWYTLLAMVGNVLVQALQVQNRQRQVVALRAAGLLLNILLNGLFLFTLRDPRGAAVASVLAEALVLVLLFNRFQAAGWPGAQMMPGLLRVLAAGGAAALAMLLGGALHPLVGGAAGLVVYGLALVYGGGLTDDDRGLLAQVLAALPGGGVVLRWWQRGRSLTTR
ncbi:MAG: oligosaccharide flippase family protein [Anaerolineae bacterium]|jgi:O-antigen/teichoic acid export membrane protein|nr:oligosaccharide flippase family protein [Anaerolineae bacterium]